MSDVKLLTVSVDEGEQRLDRWFKRRFPHVTQGAVEKMCRTGQVRVNGGRVKASDRVEPGMEIRIPPLPTGAAPSRPATDGVSAADTKMIQDCVIFRDEHLIILNKPAGLPSQGGSGQGDRHVDGLTEALKFGYKDRPKLVHRLDKDTSGLLMLARTDRVARALSEALRHRNTRKIYWAAVAGVPNPRKGSIKYGLMKAGGRGRGGEGEKMVCVHPAKMADYPDAKRAHTDFFVLWFLGTRLSWMALEPVTGRTHQLRAHMSELGHPILGDGKYGGSGTENMGDGWGASIGGEISKKLHLHARFLKIEHPITKKMMTFTAPLPDHMARTWKTLDWGENDVPSDPFEDDL
ncbi:MAG: RluA family pseudouridine synthase [Pseudorhodobacter sp.]|jgi:23S rRNA pseudouridine955/2504/2580 synthase|nr:RluA family pseudouridine synthase [Pseudorhodobacter sp.]